jgi:hypothetical protein
MINEINFTKNILKVNVTQCVHNTPIHSRLKYSIV